MCKKGKSYFDYVLMFSFSGAILLMCVRTRNKVRYDYLCKEGMKRLIFTSLVSLNSKIFSVEQPFNKVLEILEFLKNFRFEFEKIYSSEFSSHPQS
jgi:hypothetical protein